MPEIKTRKVAENKIKTLDKKKVFKKKLKNNIVNIRDKEFYTNNIDNTEENSISEYNGNKVLETSGIVFNRSINTFNKSGQKSLQTTVNNFKKIKQKQILKKNIKNIKSVTRKTKGRVQKAKKTIKTAKNTAKAAGKTTKATVKGAKKAYQVAKATAKATVKTIKVAVKATISAIKGIVLATKALIAFLVAGGWVVVVIVVVICLIALLCSSIFGIFFSSENTNSTITVGETQEIITMNKVVSDLNMEFMNKITQIQRENEHTDYDINSNRASWQDVLAIYSIKLNGGDNQTEVLTLNDERVNLVKEIFWEMNKVSYNIENITEEKTIEKEDGTTEKVTINKKILHITINGKTAEEMADKYNFNENQREQLAEITDEKYASMWSAVIYGSSVGSSDIVAVAISQIGNVGGEPYWSWYGFNSRVEWCACFVSWCANECGYIESGIIPKFAGCQAEGVQWFKTCDLWKDGGFTPKSRRYYFL